MFVLSKIFDVLVQPGNLALVALMVAGILLRGRRAALGRIVVWIVALTMLVLAVFPWDAWLVTPLENRFPPPAALPEHIDGIVVLGGALDPEVSNARGQPSLNSAAERITTLVELGRRHPEARLVFTGGSGSATRQDLKEAPVAKAFLDQMGVNSGRVLFEGQSRNTRENAVFTRDLVQPQAEQTWLLVTSALHMPRAVGTFRAAGWRIVPYPVDYLTSGAPGGLRFNVGGGLGAINAALHEYQGMAYYRLRGWSDSLLPHP